MSTEVVSMTLDLEIMGSAISISLMRAGYKVVGYDVLPRRAARNTERLGGTVAGTCRKWLRPQKSYLTSLPSADAVDGHCKGDVTIAAGHRQIVIETSTLPIPVKEEALKLLAAGGILLLDCPWSGTGAQARLKDLVVYASGDSKSYRRIAAVLASFSRAHYYVGAFGAGSKMKFVANLLVAIHNVAAAEAMVLARKSGLDSAMVLKVVADGAGNSRMLEVRGPMMVKGDYSDATMKVQVWQKDMTTIEASSRASSIARRPYFRPAPPFIPLRWPWGCTRKTPRPCAPSSSRWRTARAAGIVRKNSGRKRFDPGAGVRRVATFAAVARHAEGFYAPSIQTIRILHGQFSNAPISCAGT